MNFIDGSLFPENQQKLVITVAPYGPEWMPSDFPEDIPLTMEEHIQKALTGQIEDAKDDTMLQDSLRTTERMCAAHIATLSALAERREVTGQGLSTSVKTAVRAWRLRPRERSVPRRSSASSRAWCTRNKARSGGG